MLVEVIGAFVTAVIISVSSLLVYRSKYPPDQRPQTKRTPETLRFLRAASLFSFLTSSCVTAVALANSTALVAGAGTVAAIATLMTAAAAHLELRRNSTRF
jgi:hypothetical protein